MVDYAFRLRQLYPDCRLYSNIRLFNIKYYHFETTDQLINALNQSNGSKGVILLIDEAHLFFNRKDGISLDVLTAISQQRKDRVKLVFSTQIWEELDISLRKQVKEIVNCRCLFGNIQINTISDGETLTYNKQEGEYQAKKIRTELFKHNDNMYIRYDTFQKITTNKNYQRIANPLPLVYNQNIIKR